MHELLPADLLSTLPIELEPLGSQGNGEAEREWWRLEVDVGHLPAGRSYRLCTDLDGDGGSLAAGDTGLAVFVSPITTLAPAALLPSNVSELVLGCGGGGEARSRGGCRSLAGGFLSSGDCSGAGAAGAAPGASGTRRQQAAARSPPLEADAVCALRSVEEGHASSSAAFATTVGAIRPLGRRMFVMELDTQCLPSGVYRLCLLDAQGMRSRSSASGKDSGHFVEILSPMLGG